MKIKIYKKYKGDIDSWSRNGSINEKKVMIDSDWYLIDSIIQDIFLARRNDISPNFINNLNLKIKHNCDGDESIKLLYEISEDYLSI